MISVGNPRPQAAKCRSPPALGCVLQSRGESSTEEHPPSHCVCSNAGVEEEKRGSSSTCSASEAAINACPIPGAPQLTLSRSEPAAGPPPACPLLRGGFGVGSGFGSGFGLRSGMGSASCPRARADTSPGAATRSPPGPRAATPGAGDLEVALLFGSAAAGRLNSAPVLGI